MKRKQASDYSPEILRLFDLFVHGDITRRQFIDRAAARVNAGWPAYEAALTDNGVDFTAYIYDGANHGFNNDTTPRFDQDSAARAWRRTLSFFDRHLS